MSVLVIGGGPAGMAAALEVANAGVAVRIIDNNSDLGGQYWRGTATPLSQAVRAHPLIEVTSATAVWNVTREQERFVVRTLCGGVEEEVVAEKVILATGAYDRSLPFPGWDLPGVMTAGGAQALIKAHAQPFATRVVVAGSGPFLLPVAAALIEAGVTVHEVCEARSPFRWLRHLRAILGNPARLLEAAHYLRVLRSHGARISYGSRVVSAHGERSVTSVVIQDRVGTHRQWDVDGIAVGWGFTPDLSVAQGFGITPTMVDDTLVIQVDVNQRTAVSNVFAAGEVTGIGGARLSLIEGKIAGFSAVGKRVPWRLRERRAHYRFFAKALADVYRIDSSWQQYLTDDTVVCRCEEVTMGTICQTINDLGATDTRSMKLLARTGMGLCQGRVCGQAVAEIVANQCDRDVKATDLLAHRPVITPIALGTLATFKREERT